MVFSSKEFIFMFLPIVLIGYYTLGRFASRRIQKCFLVLASLFFYGYFKVSYLFIIITSIIVNYIIATLLQKHRENKFIFITGIIFNIGLLVYYKYFDFLIESINTVFQQNFSLYNILLPLGISFFTFQQFSFLVSVKKGQERVSSFLDYSLFVTFFPQLVAGPIVTYNEMIPQFEDKNRSKISLDNMATGTYIFVLGLFKKLVIADTLALYVNNGFNLSEFGLAAAWATSLAYTLQIYFDFSGYSDMAIGLGKMFNIDLPLNFNSPYKSASIREFWLRWHITLGKSLSNFIYIPLGGNRKGKLKTYRNLFITFLVSGIWHGASWTFVLWGILHGVFSIFDRVFKDILDKIPHKIKVFTTFLTVNALWVLFRAPSFEKATAVFKGMLNFKNIGIYQLNSICYDGVFSFPLAINLALLVGIFTVLFIIVFCFKNAYEYMKDFKASNLELYKIVILFLICVIHLSRVSTFIYFNF